MFGDQPPIAEDFPRLVKSLEGLGVDLNKKPFALGPSLELLGKHDVLDRPPKLWSRPISPCRARRAWPVKGSERACYAATVRLSEDSLELNPEAVSWSQLLVESREVAPCRFGRLGRERATQAGA